MTGGLMNLVAKGNENIHFKLPEELSNLNNELNV